MQQPVAGFGMAMLVSSPYIAAQSAPQSAAATSVSASPAASVELGLDVCTRRSTVLAWCKVLLDDILNFFLMCFAIGEWSCYLGHCVSAFVEWVWRKVLVSPKWVAASLKQSLQGYLVLLSYSYQHRSEVCRIDIMPLCYLFSPHKAHINLSLAPGYYWLLRTSCCSWPSYLKSADWACQMIFLQYIWLFYRICL